VHKKSIATGQQTIAFKPTYEQPIEHIKKGRDHNCEERVLV
jgi:hypothetical protein